MRREARAARSSPSSASATASLRLSSSRSNVSASVMTPRSGHSATWPDSSPGRAMAASVCCNRTATAVRPLSTIVNVAASARARGGHAKERERLVAAYSGRASPAIGAVPPGPRTPPLAPLGRHIAFSGDDDRPAARTSPRGPARDGAGAPDPSDQRRTARWGGSVRSPPTGQPGVTAPLPATQSCCP